MLEHPDYISILFEISGCPIHCPECHTPELQTDIGEVLSPALFIQLIKRYISMIDCVIFFGGDQYPTELIRLLTIAKMYRLKTCLWTGVDSPKKIHSYVLSKLDYLKYGPYDKTKGNLRSIHTNQKYINLHTGELIKL